MSLPARATDAPLAGTCSGGRDDCQSKTPKQLRLVYNRYLCKCVQGTRGSDDYNQRNTWCTDVKI